MLNVRATVRGRAAVTLCTWFPSSDFAESGGTKSSNRLVQYGIGCYTHAELINADLLAFIRS